MKTIYIVQGVAGEWESLTEWTVCAYADEEKAKNRIKELTDLMHEFSYDWADLFWTELEDGIKMMRTHEKGDPDFECHDRNTSYYYYPIKFIDD